LFKALTLHAGPGTLTTTPYSSLAACIKVLPVLTSTRVVNYSLAAALHTTTKTKGVGDLISNKTGNNTCVRCHQSCCCLKRLLVTNSGIISNWFLWKLQEKTLLTNNAHLSQQNLRLLDL